ncbi:MAG: 5-methyltetrahydropteroyltriglutamate--homocysteine methyltransferase [Halobacteriaceae archaeon]
MDRVATTPGLYPLPEDAKDRLADQKGHQREDLISGDEPPAVESTYEDAREWAIGLQASAGLDRVVEGQLRWDDMLAHPLAVHDAVRTAGIVRYYDNNNFYREPVIEGDLDFDGDVARELEAAAVQVADRDGDGGGLQAVLPGPYSLAELATDEHYGDEDTFLAAVGDFLAGEAAAFPDAVETLFLLEPSLVTDPPAGDRAATASEAVDAVAAAVDADVVVHTYWGAMPEKTYAHLLDAGIDAVGFDVVTEAAREPNLTLIGEYGAPDDVALGLVDGQNTRVESAETVDERVEWFEESLPSAVDFDTAYLTVNTELFYLPVSRLEGKLQALAAAAEVGE